MNPYDVLAIVFVLVMVFPYFALLRLIWYAGTYFKNRSYYEVITKEKNIFENSR